MCPACGCDLYARPPRSYAELEGFAGAEEEPAALSAALCRPDRGRRLDRLSNWGTVSFVVVLLLVIVAQAAVLVLQSAGG